MKGVKTIFFKEFKEVLRDRRTLVFMLLLPMIVLPLIFNFVTDFMQKQSEKAKKETLTYALINGDQFPQLAQLLADDESFELVSSVTTEDELVPAIKNRDIKFGLVIPASAGEYTDAGYALDVSLVYNNAALTDKVVSRTQRLVERLNTKMREVRFEAIGVSNPLQQEGFLEPTKVIKSGYATKREIIGETVGGFLPYLFVIFCFMGAFYPAIDIGAGEKERGTLETLLLTPVSRSALVLGKFGVIFTSAVVAAVVSLSSMAGWIMIKGKSFEDELGEIFQSFGMIDLFLIFLMILPLAALFASLMLAISIFAKNFKEAQNFIAPLQFLLIFPAFAAFLPGVELNSKTAMIPITNISLAVKELAKGTVDYGMVMIIFASTVVLAAGATFFCVKWFQREDVLFRN